MITEALIARKLDRNINDSNTVQNMAGETLQGLWLPLGSTALERVVNPDGSYGEIRIRTEEFGDPLHLSIQNSQYKISDGKLTTNVPGKKAERIHPYRRLKLLAKVALSRSYHDQNAWFGDEYEIGG